MSEALPTAMVARLTRLAGDLHQWAQAHPDVPLAEQEQAVLGLVRSALPDLLAAVLSVCTSALRWPSGGHPQSCPRCARRWGSQDWRRRRVLTVCGPIAFTRPYHYCRHCHVGWAPADAGLALGPYERLSDGLRAWVVELGATTAFRQAAGLLTRLTGLTVAAETVRRQTEGFGAHLEAAQQAVIARVAQTREPAEALDRAPGLLVVETDGVMVRYVDGWHEVKLGGVGGHQAGKTRALSYVAARHPPLADGPRLLAEAARRGALEVVGWQGPVTGRGLAHLRPVTVIGDGAHWICNLAADHFGERTEVVDFYHAGEHVWDVAKALYGEGSAEATTWAHDRIEELSEQGADPVLAAVRQVHPATAAAAEVVRRERGYFVTNRTRMAYPSFRAQGIPLGSGAIESGAKHVVQLRMKRPGARWSEAGGQGVLMVRTHLLSGRPLVRSPAPTAA